MIQQTADNLVVREAEAITVPMATSAGPVAMSAANAVMAAGSTRMVKANVAADTAMIDAAAGETTNPPMVGAVAVIATDAIDVVMSVHVIALAMVNAVGKNADHGEMIGEDETTGAAEKAGGTANPIDGAMTAVDGMMTGPGTDIEAARAGTIETGLMAPATIPGGDRVVEARHLAVTAALVMDRGETTVGGTADHDGKTTVIVAAMNLAPAMGGNGIVKTDVVMNAHGAISNGVDAQMTVDADPTGRIEKGDRTVATAHRARTVPHVPTAHDLAVQVKNAMWHHPSRVCTNGPNVRAFQTPSFPNRLRRTCSTVIHAVRLGP